MWSLLVEKFCSNNYAGILRKVHLLVDGLGYSENYEDTCSGCHMSWQMVKLLFLVVVLSGPC